MLTSDRSGRREVGAVTVPDVEYPVGGNRGKQQSRPRRAKQDPYRRRGE